MILVTGATGNAGSAVVRALVDRGEQVRALVRDEQAGSLPQAAQRAVGDLNRPETLQPHLDGVAAAFLLSGYEGLDETLANMRAAGGGRGWLSSRGPGGGAPGGEPQPENP